jgi:type I restriction enzyme R subunit
MILGDEVLRKIAHELVDQVRKNGTIDWTVKENVKAKMRGMVKRILNKYITLPINSLKLSPQFLSRQRYSVLR